MAREPRRLVADETHPMRDEIDRIAARRPRQPLPGADVNVSAPHAGADRLARRHLDGVHLAEQVLELAIGLALDRHAAEVADIAL